MGAQNWLDSEEVNFGTHTPLASIGLWDWHGRTRPGEVRYPKTVSLSLLPCTDSINLFNFDEECYVSVVAQITVGICCEHNLHKIQSKCIHWLKTKKCHFKSKTKCLYAYQSSSLNGLSHSNNRSPIHKITGGPTKGTLKDCKDGAPRVTRINGSATHMPSQSSIQCLRRQMSAL